MSLIKGLLLGAIGACSIAVAHATPTTWVDNIDFNPDRYITTKTSFSYSHDIRDDGFTPLGDLIYDYSLTVDLYDDGDRELEVALIDSIGVLGDTIFFQLSGQEFGGWSLAGYTQLALTGLYDVTVSALSGDFFLGSSTLVVRGDDRQSVPEPGTVGMLALAAIGAVWASRRKLTFTRSKVAAVPV
jgi:hypothetical protein